MTEKTHKPQKASELTAAHVALATRLGELVGKYLAQQKHSASVKSEEQRDGQSPKKRNS